MSLVDVEQLKVQRALLVEAQKIRELLTRGVRYLAAIAGELEQTDAPVSFFLTVETGPER